MKATETKEVREVPQQIFDKFLAELGAAGIGEHVVKRLQTTLMRGDLSDESITSAILTDNS